VDTTESRLFRCIAAGIYNKVPGDGREFCATVDDAVTVRARMDVTTTVMVALFPICETPVTLGIGYDAFSSGEASGSTSQAANVVEAMEMGCSAFSVDEDVSAANFMARDGRMRSLVMDESMLLSCTGSMVYSEQGNLVDCRGGWRWRLVGCTGCSGLDGKVCLLDTKARSRSISLVMSICRSR
jgi:predicted ABC-class ATPase